MEIKKVDENVDFICPHCKTVLKELLTKQVNIHALIRKPVYACPECKCIIPGPTL